MRLTNGSTRFKAVSVTPQRTSVKSDLMLLRQDCRGGKVKTIGKVIDKIPANAMVKTAALGGLVGAKGTLEGEGTCGRRAVSRLCSQVERLASARAVSPYHFGRIFPKYSRGSGLDKEIKNIQAQFPEGTRYMTKDAIESELHNLTRQARLMPCVT